MTHERIILRCIVSAVIDHSKFQSVQIFLRKAIGEKFLRSLRQFPVHGPISVLAALSVVRAGHVVNECSAFNDSDQLLFKPVLRSNCPNIIDHISGVFHSVPVTLLIEVEFIKGDMTQ